MLCRTQRGPLAGLGSEEKRRLARAPPCHFKVPPQHTPARRHGTHSPAAGTGRAGGHRPRRGSCRSPQRPSRRVAAPGLPDGRPSPPAAPQHPPVSIAPASWRGETRRAALEDGDRGVTSGPPCKPPRRINPPACMEKTYPVRAPAHDRVTSVPTCPYCTPGGTDTQPQMGVSTPPNPMPAAVSPSGAGRWLWGRASCRYHHGGLGRTGPSWGWAMGLQGGGAQRTPIATGLRFVYTPILVGLCLPGGMGCLRDPHAWDTGAARGARGGSPSSPQPSGMAREADARAAARNTITLPRPGMGLRIWRRQSGEGAGVIPCNGAASSIHSPEHPCRTTDPASLPLLNPSCQGQHVDRTAGTAVRTAGRVCGSPWLPRSPRDWSGDAKGKD